MSGIVLCQWVLTIFLMYLTWNYLGVLDPCKSNIFKKLKNQLSWCNTRVSPFRQSNCAICKSLTIDFIVLLRKEYFCAKCLNYINIRYFYISKRQAHKIVPKRLFNSILWRPWHFSHNSLHTVNSVTVTFESTECPLFVPWSRPLRNPAMSSLCSAPILRSAARHVAMVSPAVNSAQASKRWEGITPGWRDIIWRITC